MQSTLTSKGQVTIPKAVRDTLKLHVGDRLEFIVDRDGTVRLMPATRPVTDLKALLARPARALSLEEIDAVIAERGAAAPRRRRP